MKSIPNCHEVKSYCQETIETHELGAQVDLLTGGIVSSRLLTHYQICLIPANREECIKLFVCQTQMLKGKDLFSFKRMTSDSNQGGSSHVGMSPASVKAAGNSQSSSSTRKETSSRTHGERQAPGGEAGRRGIWLTLQEKFSTIKGSPIVTRRKGYTKELYCPSVSYKNDKLIYP